MNRLKSAPIFFILFFLYSIGLWAQSIMPPSGWLKVSTSPTWGSLDHLQVVIFEIPASTSGNLYFGIHSPACNNAFTEDQDGDVPGIETTNFHLVGDQAFSNSSTRQLTYADAATAIGTTAIESKGYDDDQVNGDRWFYFSPVTVNDGEQIGNKVYFKVVAEIPDGLGSIYKNGFQLDVFDGGVDQELAPTGSNITGAKSFAYSISYDLSAAGDHYFYPFVPDTETNNICFSNNDGDVSGGDRKSYAKSFSGGESAGVDLSINNNRRNDTYAIGGANDQTWRDRVNLSAAAANNTSEFWYWGTANNYSNDTAALPPSGDDLFKIYSSSFDNSGSPTLDHVVIDAGDGSALADDTDTQRVYFQIVDSSGDPASYSRTLTLTYTDPGGVTLTVDAASDGDPDTNDATLVTDNDGFGWIDIRNSAEETVTVRVDWAFGTASFDSVTVNFSDFTWDGSSGTDWFDGTNWAGGSVPGPTDNATIPVVGTVYPVLTANVSGVNRINDLIIHTGASVDLAGFDMVLDGNLDHNGTVSDSGAAGTLTVAGTSHLAGNITTNGGNINLQSAADLGRNITLTSGGGDISFGATVDEDGFGPWSLTLDSGAGNISVTGAVGGIDPLSALTIGNANNATFSGAVTIPSLSQTAGTGTTQFSSTLSTTAAGGIDLNGAAFTFNNAVTTAAAGPMTITNSGLLTLANAADPNLDGAFTVDGNGAITLAADITTTADAITFDGTGTLTVSDNGAGSDVTLTSGGANIRFDGDVGGAGLLELVPGAGDVSFTSTVGSGVALSGLLFTTTGNTSFASSVAVDDEGLSVTTNTGSFSGAVTTTNLGTVSINNSGLLTAAAAADFNLDGSFTQINTGALQLACDITTTGDNISFANAVTLTGNSAYDTGTGVGGNISFTSAIDGAFALVLDAGNGTVSFGGAVGSTTPLASLDITTGAAMALPFVETTAALDVVAAGAITDTTTLTIGGAVTMNANAGAANITLDDNGDATYTNTFGTLNLTGAAVTVYENAAMDLGTVSAANLTVQTETGNITDTGTVTVTAAGSFTTASNDNDIDLGTLAGAGTIALTTNGTTGNATIGHIGNVDLAASTVDGNLSVTSNGSIVDSGTLTVSGTVTMTANAGASNITLDDNGDATYTNTFGTLVLTGSAVTVYENAAMDLGTVNAANLTVETVTGNITDSGTVTVTAAGSYTTAANDDDIDLGTLAGAGTIALTTNGTTGNATIVHSGNVDLAASTVDGTLNVTSGGTIVDSGTLTVSDTVTMVANAGGSDITLDDDGAPYTNSFGTLVLTGDNVTVYEAASMDIGASTVATNLLLDSSAAGAGAGDMTQSGALDVNGTTSLTANTSTINLNNNANDFTGAVSVADAGAGGTVTLHDANSIDLGPVACEDLTVNAARTAAGSITETGGALTLSGTGTFDLNTANGDIDISTQANNIAGVITVGTAPNVINLRIRNDNATAAVPVLPATGMTNLELIFSNAAITLPAISITGNLDVTSGGAITDTGILAIGGITTMDASNLGPWNITLDDDGAPYTSTFGQLNLTGAAVTVYENAAMDLGTVNVANLTVETVTGNITDSGTVTVTAAGSYTTAANDDDINLGTLAGAGTIALTTNGTTANATIVHSGNVDLAASTVDGILSVTSGGTIVDSGALTVSGTVTMNANAGGSAITLDDDGAPYTSTFGQLNLTGSAVTVYENAAMDLGTVNAANLTVETVTGNITDSGTVTVTAAGSYTTAANDDDIDLGTLAGAGTIALTTNGTTGNATIGHIGNVDLAASTVDGNLSVTSNGSIVGSGALTVSGTSTFNANAGASDLTLAAATNSFGDALIITNANNATIVDNNSPLELGACNVAGLLLGRANAIQVEGAVVASSLDLDADGGAGTITDTTGTLTIATTSTLRAQGTDIIQLDGNNNFVGALSVTNCNDLTVNDTNALDFGAVITQDAITVTAGGNITDNGTQTIGGLASYTAPNNADIILDDAGNSFAANVTFASGGTLNDVTIVDTTVYDIQPMTINGDFYLTCGAAVTQTGVLTTNSTAIDGAGTDVNLSSANNMGTLALDRAGGTLTVVNNATLDIGTASGVSGITGTSLDLDVTAGNLTNTAGSVTATGASFDVAGTIGTVGTPVSTNLTNLEALAGDDIYFSEADAVNVGGADAGMTGISTNAANGLISLVNTGAGTIDINELVTADGSGSITLNSQGALTIDAVVSSFTGSIALSSVGDTNLGADVTTGGAGAIAFNDSVRLTAANLDVNATGTGNVSFNDTIDNAQNLTIAAGLGDVSFVGAVGSTADVSALTVSSSGSVTATTTIQAASVSLTSTGAVTLNGNVDVTGAAGFSSTGVTFTAVGIDSSAGTGAITVNHSSNVNLNGAIASAGGDVDLDSTGGSIVVAAAADISTTSGDVTFGAGAVSTAGDVTTTAATGNVYYTNAVALTGNVVINAVGDVTFNNTVNADAAPSVRDLTVGGNDILFSQNVGATFDLNSLSISGATSSTTANGTIDANSMTITGGGNVDLNGTVDTPSGFTSSGGSFDNTGATITTNNSNLTVNHSEAVTIGAALSTGAGVGGNVDLDASVGVATINISAPISSGTGNVTIDSDNGTTVAAASNITTAGGSVSIGVARAGVLNLSSNISTANGDITCQRAVTLNGGGTITFDSGAGAVGDITFGAAVNATAGEDLVIDSGSADVYMQGIIGGVTPLAALDIDAADVELFSIGTAGAGNEGISGNLDVASLGGILLDGGNYCTAGTQLYQSDAAAIRIYLTSSGEFRATSLTFGNAAAQAAGNFGDIYLSFDTFTLTLYVNITCGMFAFFDGTLDLNGRTIATSNNAGRDFVVYGAGYNTDDPDWTAAGDGRFAYPDSAGLAYDPGAPYSAAFSDLDGSTITVGSGASGDFYVNGADMDASGNWSLTVRDNSASNPVFNNAAAVTNWGSPYNIAFNMNVQNSQVANGSIAAAVANVGANNGVTTVGDGGGTGTGNIAYNPVGPVNGWDFACPSISVAATAWDDVFYVTFTEPIENDNNQISAIIGQTLVGANGNAADVTDTFMAINNDGTSTGNSTDGDGDIASFYIRVATTWNTDANNASPGGGASSTDTSGTNQATIPNISILKAAFYDAGGKNPVRNYGNNGFGAYQTVSDGCGPVIIDVTTGQYGTTGNEYDNHNYMTLTYSEPVKYMEDDGTTAIAGAGIGNTITNDISENYSFNGSGYLGQIPDVTGANVNVTITGLMTYDGNVVAGGSATEGFVSGSIPGATYSNSNNTLDKPASGYSLTINIVGYSPDGGTTWEGYLGQAGMDLIQPANYAGLASVNVQDANNNSQKITTNPITQVGGGWDVDPPGVAEYTISGAREIIPLDNSGGDSILDRFEFHLHDDFYTSDGGWDTDTDHPDGNGGGMRDSSLLNNTDAFYFGIQGTSLVNTYNDAALNTEVVNSTYNKAGAIADDQYFSILMTGAPWDTLSRMETQYDEDVGYMTDLAGNRLRDFQVLCVEYIPPEIDLTLCAPGNDWIYVRFSEPVFGNLMGGSIDAGDLYYSGGSLSITNVTQYSGGITNQEFLLQLDGELIRNDIFTGKIYVNPTSIYDADGNAYRDSIVRQISDLGLDVVEPIWASDGIHDESIREGSTLTDFDGTGRLLDRNITLQARINASVVADSSMRMYYDVDVPGSKVVDELWLPSYHSILSPLGNFSARYLNSSESLGNGLQNFVLPASDEEVEDGNTIEFIFMVDGLPCVRMATAGDIWSYEPWSFDIDDIRKQRGGVTILNNVINPKDGDKAVLMYEIPSSGVVTAQIFSLNGSLVKILHRGRQAKGSYQYTWDGRNHGGRIVARGIYFVRVVGPDTDEIRKIMVVK